MQIEISPHAREQMAERGASEDEVIMAVERGEVEPARKGRVLYRKNFSFGKAWRGKKYTIKQVVPVVLKESNRLTVVTVYVFYF